MQISDNFSDLITLLQNQERALKVAIIPHLNPDGDAIGAAAGLALFLKELGHTPVIVSPTDVPYYLGWIPGAETVLSDETDPKAARAAVQNADLVFCVDYGVASRAGKLPDSWTGKPTVNIDHHVDYKPFTDYFFRDVTASSTCELIYRFIRAVKPTFILSPALSTAVYTGILTDTGSFRYRSTTPAVHRVVAELMEAGADFERVHLKIYNSHTENRTRLQAYCISEYLRVLPEYRAAYLAVPHEALMRFHYQEGDTEGLVSYPLSIENINLGVMILENRDMIRMSFRSIGRFPANKLAAHFNGGGHHNAAGGRSFTTLAETESRFLDTLKTYKDDLQYSPGE